MRFVRLGHPAGAVVKPASPQVTCIISLSLPCPPQEDGGCHDEYWLLTTSMEFRHVPSTSFEGLGETWPGGMPTHDALAAACAFNVVKWPCSCRDCNTRLTPASGVRMGLLLGR